MRRIIKFFLPVIIFTLAVFCSHIFSYDSDIAHPYLTEKAVELFNKNSEIQISQQQLEWLKQGAIEEDTPIRWMNHFYNPINGLGIFGFSSAKDWSRESVHQLLYPKGNQTWQKAIDSYVKGDKKSAFIALGHILHLIEDMSVPAHTRDDAHPEGDPYESWVKNNTNKNFDGLSMANFDNLDNFFDLLANYSNKYFLSKDSVNISQLENKERFVITTEQGKYKCIKGEKNHCLILIKKELGEDKYFFDWPVHSDYYSLLAPKAISYGAGVIDLFFKEVEIKEQKQQEKSWFDKLIGSIAGVFRESGQIAAPVIVVAPQENNDVGLPMSNIGEEGGLVLETDTDTVPPAETLIPSPVFAPTPTPSPVKSLVFDTLGVIEPKFSVSSLPYPGFGGGGGGGGTQNSNEQEQLEQVEQLELSDTTPPDVSLSVSECENSLSSDSCLLMIDSLNILWFSTAEDLDCFEFTNNGETSTTSATSTTISVSDNSSNIFSIRAKDKTGNWSDPQATTVVVYSMPVVINEVAWAGTADYPYDEWIELYNRTNYGINLNNWILYSQTDNSPYINLSGTIPAKGYYLIERKTENKTSSQIFDNDNNSLADLFVSFSYGLNNSGEVLILSHASTTIDQTALCIGSRYQWPPCYDYSYYYYSMERVDPDIAGTDFSNWSTNNSLIMNGKTAKDGVIYGTPKARNSVNYLIDNGRSNISSDITLKKSRSPYLVNNQVQNFSENAVLTIEPGVTIKFYNNAGLSFSGNSKIISQGIAEEPIIFTAFEDDEYGGDTNNNATSSSPWPGAWYGIRVETSNNDSVFENTIFRYGGKFYSGWGIAIDLGRTNLTVQNSSVNISNSIFEYSFVHGLKILNSDSIVSGNIFRNNNNERDPAGYNAALVVSGNSPLIQNNNFTENARGIYLSGSTAIVDSNIFQSNKGEAIYFSGPFGSFINNSGSNNNINGIFMLGEITSADATFTMHPNPLPYVMSRYGAAVVANSTLIISSGVVIKSDTSLAVNGNLIIDGQNPDDIIFTSLYDDSVAGDTGNDSDTNPPQAGQGGGIAILNTGSLSGKGFTIRYGGSNAYMGQNSGAIMIDGALANISNALFDNNYPHGIYAVSSPNIVIENASFENHNYTGSWGIKAALAVYNSTTTLSNVSFKNNLLGIANE